MKRGKLHKVDIVEQSTGIVLAEDVIAKDAYSFDFGMHHLTPDMAWMSGLNGKQIQMVFVLGYYASSKENYVGVTPKLKKHICHVLEFSERTLYRNFTALSDKGVIKMTSSLDLYINPKCIYKFKSDRMIERIIFYEEL